MEIRYTDVDYDRRSQIGSSVSRFINRLDFSWKNRESLYQMLSIRLRVGMSEASIIRMFAVQARRNRQKSVCRVTDAMIGRLQHGETLTETLRPYIPDDEYMIIMAGEKAGTLPDALELLCESKSGSNAMLHASFKALAQPLLYLAVIYVFLYVMGTTILPGLINGPLAPKTPSTSQKVLMVATSLATGWYGPILITVLVTSALVIWQSLSRLTGPLRVMLERIPPWSLYRDIQGFIWISSFLALVRAGVPDKDAVRLQSANASPWLRERLDAIYTNLTVRGMSFPDSLLETGLAFPSPRIMDDVEANWINKAGYDRLYHSTRHWATTLEKRTIAFAKRTENGFVYLMIGLSVVLTAACENLGTDVSHMTNF